MNDEPRKRKGTRSQRRMTAGRRFLYRAGVPVGIGILKFFWAACRERIHGGEKLEQRLAAGEPVIFCYWHRHQLFCWYYLRRLLLRGAKVGWLISASVDGEVPTKMARAFGGGVVFRGSTTSRGSEALRAIAKAVVRDRISPCTTPDGPYGPRSQFKPGIVKMAQLSGAPLLPIAYGARSAWVLRTWDRFVVPRPFTKVVICVGDPVPVPRDLDEPGVEALQRRMEQELESLFQRAHALARQA